MLGELGVWSFQVFHRPPWDIVRQKDSDDVNVRVSHVIVIWCFKVIRKLLQESDLSDPSHNIIYQ